MDHPDDGFSAHALNRCFDRYGFVPTVEEAAECMAAILSGRARIFGKGRGDTARVRVRCGGHLVNLVFSHSQKRVLTLLPPDDARFVLTGPSKFSPTSESEQRKFFRRRPDLCR